MPQLGLDSLSPGTPSRARKRVGRGPGSGHGKTSGKGHKGQKARSGGVKGRGFEGGQLPLQRRLPKRGFTNARFRKVWRILNVGVLQKLPPGSEATPETLVAAGLLRDGREPLKVLGDGVLRAAIAVTAHAVSAGARRKIEAAGGRITLIDGAGPAEPGPRRSRAKAGAAADDGEAEASLAAPPAETAAPVPGRDADDAPEPVEASRTARPAAEGTVRARRPRARRPSGEEAKTKTDE